MTTQSKTSVKSDTSAESEGKALATMYNRMQSADVKRTKVSIAEGGFDYRLGQLLQTLRAELPEGKSRITSPRLKACGLNVIDKRRRAEALWLSDNRDEAVEFVKSTGKKITSICALQNAMREASKAVADATGEEPNYAPKAVKEQVAKQQAAKLQTPTQIAAAVSVACKTANVDIMDVVEILLRSQEQATESTAKAKQTKAEADAYRAAKAA
jgi:hypothetical protein